MSTATVSLIDKTSAIAITSSTTTEDREPKSPMSPTTSFPTLTDAAIGYGPVHAIFGAINRLVGTTNVLAFYSVSAVTEGSDALGRVMVRIHEADVEENHDAVNDMMDVSEYETPASAIQQQQQRASKAPKLLHGDSAPTSVNESTSTTKNNDSPSKTTPHPKAPKAMFVGQGTDEDILVASARAYLNAINRMLDYKRKQKKAMIVNGGGVGGDVSRVVLVAKNVDV